MAAAVGGGRCFIALDGGRFGLPGCSLLLRLHRRARVLRGSGYGGGGARSLRPWCLTAGRFAIADTCSYRLPDGSAPLLPVLAVDRSRPLRSRAPRPVTSPSAVGRPDAPPSRGEPGTPCSARPASAVCLASRPAARFRRSPGGSPPPPQRPPLPPRPVGLRRGAGARGRGMRGGASWRRVRRRLRLFLAIFPTIYASGSPDWRQTPRPSQCFPRSAELTHCREVVRWRKT